MEKHIKLFGTDGIRGRANDAVINPLLLSRVSAAAAQVLRGKAKKVVIGGDTRRSYAMILGALSSGFMSGGLDVIEVGVAPTPAIAYLTKRLGADFGVVISASHNPAWDNGIKFFDKEGKKISRQAEEAIETAVFALSSPVVALPNQIGLFYKDPSYLNFYVEHLSQLYAGLNLRGKRIVLDCAHGALSWIAPAFFEQRGAEVTTIGSAPTGDNINEEVGATHPHALQAAVKEAQADFGIGFDGDGDRVFFVDKQSRLLDGDQLLALIAQYWSLHGLMTNKSVVGTVMSNRGLEMFLKALDLDFVRANVGDREVAEMMYQKEALIGGESSGHLILAPLTSTGDGLLTALEVCKILTQTQETAQPVFTPSPQVHRNLPLKDPSVCYQKEFQDFLSDFVDKWQHQCSILVRLSGTEPLLRITLQGENISLLYDLTDTLAQTFERMAS